MAKKWYEFWKEVPSNDTPIVTEEIKAFEKKGDSAISDKALEKRQGEGVTGLELLQAEGYGKNLKSFNNFYRRHINVQWENERHRILSYREMAENPEISDVIEDAIIESTQENQDGEVISLEITDSEIESNQNIVENLQDEFTHLFYNRLNIRNEIWDIVRNYFIDGRVYIERIIHEGKAKNGLVNWKILPSPTMDFLYEPKTGKITYFLQYLKPNPKRYDDIEEAKKDPDVIVFYPEQITMIDYGIYGPTRNIIIGYLEKAKQPFNQLKLLETSVIIYRIIRAPERLVFKIDTGNMPRDKALKFAEKVKQKFSKRQSFSTNKGTLDQEPEIFSMLENYFLPQSADGRGSQIESIGGNPAGFAELDDIYYFAKKLYRALKYPMSRVTNKIENREGDTLFGGLQSAGATISRDEIKWSKFLERQQNKFTDALLDIFLLHLEFKGLKNEYNLNKDKLNITMNAPNQYKEQMIQNELDVRWGNYSNFSGNKEFSKYWLMKELLELDDEQIEANAEGFKKDKELGFIDDEGF